METPDLTTEDMTGIAGAITALIAASQSNDPRVQLVAVIMVGLVALAIIAAGAYRRGKRAENMAEATLYTGIAPAQEEEE